MKKLFCIALLMFSTLVFADSDYIIDCQVGVKESGKQVTYILNIKKGVAEILLSNTSLQGVLGTDEHFYTLFFTYNNKTNNEVVTTTIINRITGELTETATSKSSYPDTTGEQITGLCKSRKYERKL